MKSQKVLRIILISALLSCGCIACREHLEQIPPVSESSLRNGRDDAAIMELKQLYADAHSEKTRRAICLRAINEGLLRRGSTVFTIDQIFGTHFDSNIRNDETNASGWVLFADQVPWPSHDGPVTEARGYVGWYLAFDYDLNGVVQNYYLSNLHKGFSLRVEGKTPAAVEQLKRIYATATSDTERRDACLLAIDEGVIQTYEPMNISTVDAIFGTKLAYDLPSRKQETRLVMIDLSRASTPGSVTNGVTAKDTSWFMGIEYFYNGQIANYYLTNLKK